ncbi:PEP-CTERM sorting domain-containing protein [Tautonia sp. JC769]|uniref:PEP-CTERM sorting domain-containing protein n=1 Tax=Tautonia sp. JC769 TaxID=3232135 RepID=UPI003459C893
MCAVVKYRLQSFGALRLVAAVGVLLLVPGMASAYPLTVTRQTSSNPDVVNTGTGQTIAKNSQLVWNPAEGKWGNGNFSITSKVEATGVKNVAGVLYQEFTYTYEIIGASLSNIIIGLSESILDDEYGIYAIEGVGDGTNFKYDGGSLASAIKAHTPNSEPPAPDTIFGLKLETLADADSNSFSFKSLQSPIWGDFVAKDGGGTGDQANAVWAYNRNFGEVADPLQVTEANYQSADFDGWVITADTGRVLVPVPEPSTLAIAGLSGLAMLGYGLRRRTLARA